MSFFNKKEEVIEVILTSYGKYKLSRGEWKPKYYAFYDEDILYDSRYAGYSEISGTSEARIQEESPSMRSQTSHSDLPKQIKKLARAMKAVSVQGYGSHNNNALGAYANALRAGSSRAPYILPLGNSSTVAERNLYAPAWEIKALKNEFTASMAFASSSYENVIKIPQLKVDIDYTTEIHKQDPANAGSVLGTIVENDQTEQGDSSTDGLLPGTGLPSEMYLTTYFPDGTFIVVDDNYLVLEVNELNSAKAVDQFYVEVWEVEEDEALQPKDKTGHSLTRLSFVNYPEEIVDNILVDSSTLPDYDLSQLDDTYVDYFMSVQSDSEIDSTTVCNNIAISDLEKRQWHTVLSCYESVDDPGSVLYESENVDLIKSLCEECE
jgi:hypothetical protein